MHRLLAIRLLNCC